MVKTAAKDTDDVQMNYWLVGLVAALGLAGGFGATVVGVVRHECHQPDAERFDERKPAAPNTPYEPIMNQSKPSSKLPWVIVVVLSLVILAWFFRDLLPVSYLS